MLITCVILMMIDVVMHRQGRVTWRTTRYLDIKLFCQPLQPLCICSGVVVLAMKVRRFWFTITIFTYNFYNYVELYGANIQNTYRHIHKSYCSRPIHTKRCYWAIEMRCYWNGLSRERLKAMKALHAFKGESWRDWPPLRGLPTDPRSADYPTDYSADYPADYPYGLP